MIFLMLEFRMLPIASLHMKEILHRESSLHISPERSQLQVLQKCFNKIQNDLYVLSLI